MYNNKLVYKVVIWVFFVISLWKEKEALINTSKHPLWSHREYNMIVQKHCGI